MPSTLPESGLIVIATPIRRECLDRTLFWTAADLEIKVVEFLNYYSGRRTNEV